MLVCKHFALTFSLMIQACDLFIFNLDFFNCVFIDCFSYLILAFSVFITFAITKIVLVELPICLYSVVLLTKCSYILKVLKKENISCVVAPYEADAQMTFLAISKHVDAVITEDSDLIPFGCPTVDTIVPRKTAKLMESVSHG
ncbi:putative exodeoxyribonuclease I [Helianthus annuus]|nr:putative exodeoxyribonuclease I [Helianthus annuus]